jgi:hypothetical protein
MLLLFLLLFTSKEYLLMLKSLLLPSVVYVLFVTGISNVSGIPAVVVAPTVAGFSSVVNIP